MSSDSRELIAVLDAAGFGPRRPGGILRRRPGSRLLVSFEYARSWLDASDRFSLDPSLPLVPGEQFTVEGRLPGVFSDTAPDRWGRRLLERREAANARLESRRPHSLDEWDFLLGVADVTRMGALRLGVEREGPFLDDSDHAVPPLTRLRSLEHAARQIDATAGTVDDPDVAMLIAPGSSLGGTRPKANFLDADGGLWLAKFPSSQDRWDVGGWEHLVAAIARSAGVTVEESRARSLSPAGTTYATRRFDRDGRNRRPFISAMTMTRTRDGQEASYLELAQAVADQVVPDAIETDLEQLFRRLVFNVMVGNRDDHLRNHAFLRGPSGWRLAPAYDVNPAPGVAEHALSIDDRSHEPSIALALETRPFYRVSEKRAVDIIRDVAAALLGWEDAARRAELESDQIDLMRTVIAPRDLTP